MFPFSTGIFCYIADVTTDQNRAVKMGVLEAILFLGLLIGSLSSSYVLAWTSATSVFLIATLSILIGLSYIIFYIKESVVIHNELFEGSKFRELFRYELVKDMFRTCFKVRPNYDRLIMWLTISSLASMIFAMRT
jgi:MFS transporter, PCFT/HCP family, solute carrier family 46 (folate transporter), member 1